METIIIIPIMFELCRFLGIRMMGLLSRLALLTLHKVADGEGESGLEDVPIHSIHSHTLSSSIPLPSILCSPPFLSSSLPSGSSIPYSPPFPLPSLGQSKVGCKKEVSVIWQNSSPLLLSPKNSFISRPRQSKKKRQKSLFPACPCVVYACVAIVQSRSNHKSPPRHGPLYLSHPNPVSFPDHTHGGHTQKKKQKARFADLDLASLKPGTWRTPNQCKSW
jgi:hypothetical protein